MAEGKPLDECLPGKPWQGSSNTTIDAVNKQKQAQQLRDPDESIGNAASPLVYHETITNKDSTPTHPTEDLDDFKSILGSVAGFKSVNPSQNGFVDAKDADVLSGRGGGTNLHPGNRYFRQLIVSHSDVYDKATKSKKPLVARDVVQKIRQRGGRFLRKDGEDGLYYEIGDDLAREKASQAFRHRTFELRKQQGSKQDEEEQVLSSDKMRQPKRTRGSFVNNPLQGTHEDDSKRKKAKTLVPIASSAPFQRRIHDSPKNDEYQETTHAQMPLTAERFSLMTLPARTSRQRLRDEERTRAMTATLSEATAVDSWHVGVGNGMLTNSHVSGPNSTSFLPTVSRRPSTTSFVSSHDTMRAPIVLTRRTGSSSTISSIFANPRGPGTVLGGFRGMDPGNLLAPSSVYSGRGLGTVPLPSNNASRTAHTHLVFDGTMRATSNAASPPPISGTSPQEMSLLNPAGVPGRNMIGPRDVIARNTMSPWSRLPSSSSSWWDSDQQISANSAAYERALLAEYLSLRRIQQERVNLLDMLAQRRGQDGDSVGQEQEDERGS